MKKIIVSGAVIILAAQLSWAQSLVPDVVSTAGDYYEAGGYSLSWTLGEVAIETLSDSSNMLTQGFQQSLLISTSIPEISSLNLKIFPNPANSVVNIVNPSQNLDLSVILYDMNGKLLLQQKLNRDKTELNLSGFQKGIYLIKIFDKDQFNSSYKIQKIR